MTIIGATKLIKYLKASKAKGKQRPKMRCYMRRNERLSELGYTSYQEYLASEDWKKIRNKCLEKHPSCLLCKKPAMQVHHLEYTNETLLGLRPHRLVTLCGGCHQWIEMNGDCKRTLREANTILKKRASELGLHVWLEHAAAEKTIRGPKKNKPPRNSCVQCHKNSTTKRRSLCKICHQENCKQQALQSQERKEKCGKILTNKIRQGIEERQRNQQRKCSSCNGCAKKQSMFCGKCERKQGGVK